MKFWAEGEVHTLKGEAELHKTEITVANLDCKLNSSNLCMVELHQISDSCGAIQVPDNPHLLELMKSPYPGILARPTKLAPYHDSYHRITAIPGTAPVNQHPYKYSFPQKNEIEALVQYLLMASIIQDSHSLYTSPALLVKKKDGS